MELLTIHWSSACTEGNSIDLTILTTLPLGRYTSRKRLRERLREVYRYHVCLTRPPQFFLDGDHCPVA